LRQRTTFRGCLLFSLKPSGIQEIAHMLSDSTETTSVLVEQRTIWRAERHVVNVALGCAAAVAAGVATHC
jgi:hypothetical protein